MPTHCAVLSPQTDLTPLDAFPWLAQSARFAPAAPAVPRMSGKTRAYGRPVYASIAVGLAALWAGMAVVTGGTAEQQALVVHQARLAQAAKLPGAGAATQVSAAQLRAIGETPADVPEAPAAAQDVPARAPSVPVRLVTRTLAALPRIEPSRLDAEPVAMHAASGPAAPSSATPDSPMTAAALREFRAAVDEGKDTAREIIRLGNRQRPKDGASGEDMARYRLRQQNAEAAKTYRSYLDTLARTVRAARSETLTRQSLERARQTLGYLATMLADSRASLR